MKFGFVTCVQLGLDCLDEIYKVGGKLDFLITLKDELAKKKSGRIHLDKFAKEHEIDLLKVRHINDSDAIRAIKTKGIDWLFIIGWSQIAGPESLVAPKRGVLGMHPTLLPKGRGRASIPWAILKGLNETGVTLFKLDEGVDTGPILAQERIPIASDEIATTLYQKVCEAHRNLIHRIWTDLERDQIQLVTQNDEEATNWPGRTPDDGRILAEMSIHDVDRLVRATTHPYPGAFWENTENIVRIWRGMAVGASGSIPAGAYKITFSDGVYAALDYDLETRSKSEN